MIPTKQQAEIQIGRRAILKAGSLCLSAGVITPARTLFAQAPESVLRIGLITDLHHADKPPKGTRFYRESLGKLAEAAKQFTIDKINFVVELGDIIDAAESVEVELGYLSTVNRQYAAISEDRHYVIGNHCVDTLTKTELLSAVGQEKPYYSFDRNSYHFIVLDACFRADGEPYGRHNFVWNDTSIPQIELDWLQADLKLNDKPVIVFVHQRLDVSDNHSVKNDAEVRAMLESSGKVLAVFQGHSHNNDLSDIGGIHYCTMVAMVEGSGANNNGYSVMTITADNTILINGFRNQTDYRWTGAKRTN